MAPYVHVSQGRNPRTIAALAVAWALLAAAVFILNAALWIAGLLALATLPALWDLWRNPSAGLRIDDTTFQWQSGRRQGELALGDIKNVRFDRSWDFAIRVSVVLASGKRIRLPAETLPPVDRLETELTARGLTCERHPFSLF